MYVSIIIDHAPITNCRVWDNIPNGKGALIFCNVFKYSCAHYTSELKQAIADLNSSRVDLGVESIDRLLRQVVPLAASLVFPCTYVHVSPLGLRLLVSGAEFRS